MLDELSAAVLDGQPGSVLEKIDLPASFTAAIIRRDGEAVFKDQGEDRDVRKSLEVADVPMPEMAADEVIVASMASAINFNTVWSAIFQPMSTFRFLDRFARDNPDAERHALDYHVLGSDGAGVVVRVGAGVRHWKVGDHVVINTLVTDDQDPLSQWDGMLPEAQKAWGYETNFGGLATYTVVKAQQLLRKAKHLSWEEAAGNTLCLMTAYRMLISDRGARIKLGDSVLVWGATGGLGSFATQLAKAAGARVVGVVSSPEKAALAMAQGCDGVLDRTQFDLAAGFPAWREMGTAIRDVIGEDPSVVFEHVGAETFGASVFLARRGGTVVTCGSSSGYEHSFDNRFLWMRLKRIIGSHGANYQESWEANRLVELGVVTPTLSRVYPLSDIGEATRCVQENRHIGKVGVLCIADRPGLGIEDPELRSAVGEDRINLYVKGATS